jgi:hypothetical protein
MTAFFIPGLATHGPSLQATYGEMRKQIERRMGRPPRERRILELWTRRGNLDCVTIVGEPDPICGDTVMAIFDMGPHQPFLVYHQHGTTPLDTRYEVLDANAYDVAEFDP